MDLKISKSNLEGEVIIPPSKSLSHRAIISAALADGRSEIRNIILSDDINATINVLKNLGVQIEIKGEDGRNTLIIQGENKFSVRNNYLNCNESGSTLRFLIPFFTLVDQELIFDGENKLIERPLDSYYKIFKKQDINFNTKDSNLPLKIKGNLTPGDYHLDGDISSQFVTGLLFVLPLLDGDSRIIINKELESKGYIDLTLDILEKFGIKIINEDYEQFIIQGNQKFKPTTYTVEGDYSQAAFWIVANLLGNTIKIKGLTQNSLQGDRVILDFIKKVGADYTFKDQSLLITNKTDLKSSTFDVSDCPDLVPVLSVLLSSIPGQSTIEKAERLRFKESDRLKSTRSELNILGGEIEEINDGLVINGVTAFKGGLVSSWNDHRIAMALTIASLYSDDEIKLKEPMAINKSYPSFYEDFKSLGGRITFE